MLLICISIDCYNCDDWMVVLWMVKYVNDLEYFYIVMDEFNDVEIGKIFVFCVLIIGMCLYFVIIFMNFGIFVIVINYEYKFVGIM